MGRIENPGALAGATGAEKPCKLSAAGGSSIARLNCARDPDPRTFTASLGGRWQGSYGTAPCPVCQPERRPDQSALSISAGYGGRLLICCHKAACDFRDIVAAAGHGGDFGHHDKPLRVTAVAASVAAAVDRKAAAARRIWDEAGPISGTPGEAYLRGRGITAALPDTLAFHPACHHGPTGRALPAMIARVEGVSGTAIHRTWLRHDGTGKADVAPAKAMLGATAGGAVLLARDGPRLVVAEGIETGLALASGLLDGPATIWAALSASGMRALRLPTTPGRLVVAVDGDPAGRAAGHALATRAHGLGWRVTIADPGDGLDWADRLQTGGRP